MFQDILKAIGHTSRAAIGRIAVYYIDKSYFNGTVSVNGGLSGNGLVTSRNGQPGTLEYILK